MRSLYGIAAAMMAIQIIETDRPRIVDLAIRDEIPLRPTRRFKEPQNSGPVIDTTRESKRGRRRRLAKSHTK